MRSAHALATPFGSHGYFMTPCPGTRGPWNKPQHAKEAAISGTGLAALAASGDTMRNRPFPMRLQIATIFAPKTCAAHPPGICVATSVAV